MQCLPTIAFAVELPTIAFAIEVGVFVVASAGVNDLSAIVVDKLLASVMKTLELSARQAL